MTFNRLTITYQIRHSGENKNNIFISDQTIHALKTNKLWTNNKHHHPSITRDVQPGGKRKHDDPDLQKYQLESWISHLCRNNKKHCGLPISTLRFGWAPAPSMLAMSTLVTVSWTHSDRPFVTEKCKTCGYMSQSFILSALHFEDFFHCNQIEQNKRKFF